MYAKMSSSLFHISIRFHTGTKAGVFLILFGYKRVWVLELLGI